ncbi:MAG: hypothetical protein ACFFD5_13405 [Candidatus Thorarchaeota archaeon]
MKNKNLISITFLLIFLLFLYYISSSFTGAITSVDMEGNVIEIYFFGKVFTGNSLFYSNIHSFMQNLVIIFLGISIYFAFRLDLNKTLYIGIIGCLFMIGPIFYVSELKHLLGKIIVPLITYIVYGFLVLKKVKPNYDEETIIRSEILKMGTVNPDVNLKLISKKLSIDRSTVVKIVKKMISNKEIYAEYFRISKKIAFNIKANLEDIDRLMELYHKWEEQTIGKKV